MSLVNRLGYKNIDQNLYKAARSHYRWLLPTAEIDACRGMLQHTDCELILTQRNRLHLMTDVEITVDLLHSCSNR